MATNALHDEKMALRRKLRAVREELGVEGRARIDARIAERVCAHPAYLKSDAVFTYLSVGAEVDTRAIIEDAWSRGKLVAVPRCVPNTNLMQWYRIDSFEGMEVSSFGVEEPLPDADRLVEPPASPDRGGADASEEGSNRDAARRPMRAVAVVPAYTFDEQGYRLGYGGGFYDVFLARFDGESIGICRKAQLVDGPLPRYETDIAVDYVVTD